MAPRTQKVLLIGALVIVILGLLSLVLSKHLTIQQLQEDAKYLQGYYEKNPGKLILAFFLGYVLLAGLAIPGTIFLNLAAGAVFGLGVGVLFVPLATTCGAAVCFLLSRFLLRRHVEKIFAKKLTAVNEGVAKDGIYYLLSLRLVPIFPFILVNLIMGLTSLRLGSFFVVTLIGVLPRIVAYLIAGAGLSEVTSLRSILSLRLMSAFFILGFLPLIFKFMVRLFHSRKMQVSPCVKKRQQTE